MPTPLLFCEELKYGVYAPYGFTRRLDVKIERPEVPWLLTSLVSDRVIMSDLRLVTPYIFSL
jgi:hypothetical protein